MSVLLVSGCVSSSSPVVQDIDYQLREPSDDGEVRAVQVGRAAPEQAAAVLVVCRGALVSDVSDTVGFDVPISDPAPNDAAFLAAIVTISQSGVLEVAQIGQGSVGVSSSDWYFNPCPENTPDPHFLKLAIGDSMDFEFSAGPSRGRWMAVDWPK
jgi:hypothetical protein